MEGGKSQDQGTGRFGDWLEASSWFDDTHHLAVMEGEKELPHVSLYKGTDPIMT